MTVGGAAPTLATQLNVRYTFRMDDSPIDVSNVELRQALVVWLRTCPKRAWQDFWSNAQTIEKWRGGSDPFNRFDPKNALAEYLATKFEQAHWSVRRPQPVNHGDRTTPAAQRSKD